MTNLQLQLPPYEYKCTIVDVHDGDTLTVNIDLGFGIWTRQDIRLINCWAPELGQLGGQESKKHLEELLFKYYAYEDDNLGAVYVLRTFKRPYAKTDLRSMNRYIGELLGKGSDNTIVNINEAMITDGFATRVKQY